MIEIVTGNRNFRFPAAGLSLGSLIRVFMGDLQRKTGVGTSEGWGETFFFSVLRAVPQSRPSPF